jgi:hypothetical protein
MALPKTIKPIATTPAISTISIWIAMVINPLALLLSAKHIGMESADRHARQDMFFSHGGRQDQQPNLTCGLAWADLFRKLSSIKKRSRKPSAEALLE